MDWLQQRHTAIPNHYTQEDEAMIDALISGKLYAKAQERAGKSGKPFATAKMTSTTADGESLFVNIIAFDQAACTALLALGAGDGLAVAGPVTPKTWTDKDGNPRPAIDVVVHQVLTAYHVNRKRNAMQRQQQHERHQTQGLSSLDDGGPLDF